MGGVQNEHTVNIVDAGIFRSLGKTPNPSFNSVARAVSAAEQTLVISRDIYEELGGNPEFDPPPSESPYVAPGVEAGWIEVGDRLDTSGTVQQSVELGEQVITDFMNHPKTAAAPEDATNIGLSVQYFERNQSLHVILHTTDKALGRAARIVVPEFGYYDIEVNVVPPAEVSDTMTDPSVYMSSKILQERQDQ